MTGFATIIVTRNRPEALALSLPLHLAQSRLPERILVVDSSDDQGPNRALVARLAADAPMPVEHVASPAGMTVQRNFGLARIDSEVVFFPDDDSLVHPGTLEHMMRIYEADPEGRIGGVCAAESREPPPGSLGTGESTGESGATAYAMRRSDRLRARFAVRRARLEDRLAPDPMKLAARALQAGLPPPEPWLAGEDAVRVEWMTGFRMSFRTEVIRQVGFNEDLGRYALYEDIDAGLGVLRGGQALVAARQARIYHHKAPANRAGGRGMGVINILNRAYVTLRSGAADARIRAALLRYSRFRTLQFAMARGGAFERDRHAGAKAALAALPALMQAAPADLDGAYLRLRTACLEGDEV